ncbi:MAG: copper amine oxidase N-terminal domain-containing protein [Clostridia bacterium]|nr:copper amine oxidase N-terminal domain-containing protein [Clostridia bacterium]
MFTAVNNSVATTVKLTIGSTTAYINDEAQILDAAPINRNNRTMLPVRFLANAFGVDNDGIKWDASTRTSPYVLLQMRLAFLTITLHGMRQLIPLLL